MLPLSLAEYEALAAPRMERTAWEYYSGGSEDEVTLRENRAAFARIKLRPRVLVDISQLDITTTVLGTPVSLPVLIAPAAYQRLAHPDGEAAMARGAGTAGTLMTVSTLATMSLEDVAAAAVGPLWFQLYVYRSRDISEQLVRRAEAAGYQALVLTVDAPVLGRRERDIRNGFGLPSHLHPANFSGPLAEEPAVEPGMSGLAHYADALFDTSLTWEAVDWLRSVTKLPVVVKGILTAEDAALAVAHGAASIVVSNHGGRQLDTAVATIEALPEVVDAVAGRAEVYVDGGIRRGTDVLKALAIGARAVMIGRPALWGLAAAGPEGVRHVLELLRDELLIDMALVGRTRLPDLDRSLLRMPE